MRRNPLGRTGITVPQLTIGSGAFGRDPAQAGAMLARAFEQGLDTVELDVSDSDAVALLAAVLRQTGAAPRVQVLARLPSLVRFELPSPHIAVDAAYPGAQLRAAIDALLATLGIERVALVQLHAWCPEWLGEGDWLETLRDLGRAGKIGGIGVSLFDHDADAGLHAVASGAVHAVQVMYNLLDQGAVARLFPLCQHHGVGVIARAPLYLGALAQNDASWAAQLPEQDWRRDYFYPEHAAETAARTKAVAADDRAALALRFSLSHPAVSTVALGLRTPVQLDAALAGLAQGPLPPGEMQALTRHKWLC